MGSRGKKPVSQAAVALLDLQAKLPLGRLVYSSATGATEVSNLAYATRLGLWGPGTAFTNVTDFVTQVEGGGVAAMELVARDMKQMGLYLSRGLSFAGVEYDRVTHVLTENQRETYDLLARAWQIVLRNFNAALYITAGGDKPDPKKKAAAMSAFWGSHQRFFNTCLISLQAPAVIRDIERVLADGVADPRDPSRTMPACAVLQLVNTNEASMERALSKLDEDDDLADLDMTPRDQLLGLIENCFPVAQQEQYIDPNTGKTDSRQAVDSEGKAIVNLEAVAMRDKLLNDLATIRCPDGPLEMIINHFGYKNVAEVTGRSRRVVRTIIDGIERTEIQTRSSNRAMAEAKDFQDGRRQILIFSDAGGTGQSYHCDALAANQARRVHYLVQAGWVADQAVQGFGRTHRSNQVVPPLYKLVSTNVQAQRRFVSTIARRLDQLGALTKGQRDAASQGIFTQADNLESPWARSALVQFFRDLYGRKVEGITIDEFQNQTGLTLVTSDGALRDDLPPISQFLNRLLSLELTRMDQVFEAFDLRLRKIIQMASDAGTLDLGTETVRADRIDKVSDQSVYRHPTGAETRMVEFKLSNRTKPSSFQQLMEQRDATWFDRIEFFAINNKSQHVYAFTNAGDRTNTSNGSIEPYYYEIGPNSRKLIKKRDLRDYDQNGHPRWTRVEASDADLIRDQWTRQFEAVPAMTETRLYLLTGLLLPLYDRLPKGNVRVRRLQTAEGERFLGRVIEEAEVDDTLKRLGHEVSAASYTPQRVVAMLEAGTHTIKLVNEWKLKRSRVASEYRYEIIGPDYTHMGLMKTYGCFFERVQYAGRHFIPTGEQAVDVVTRLLKDKPVAEATRTESRAV
jgi:hypothetical protein